MKYKVYFAGFLTSQLHHYHRHHYLHQVAGRDGAPPNYNLAANPPIDRFGYFVIVIVIIIIIIFKSGNHQHDEDR